MTYAQKPALNDHAGVSSMARGLKYSLSLYLHQSVLCEYEQRIL